MNHRPWLSLPGRAALACALLLSAALPAQAAPRKAHKPAPERATSRPATDGRAEAKLLEVYRLVGRGHNRQALAAAESLVQQHPNFQLAQLVYGDLLAAQVRPVRALGDVPEATGPAGQLLAELREESLLRIKALREPPPAGAVPEQFLQLAPRTRHAIAVDTSRARLYLFENTGAGLKLLADYYISVGKLGIDKSVEGDLRTPPVS